MTDTDPTHMNPASIVGSLQLLKLALTGHRADTELAVQRVQQCQDNVLQTLTIARLSGHFFALAEGSSLLDAFTTTQLESLQSAFERQRLSNLRYLELQSRLRDLLQPKGVDFLLLKGLFLGERFYGGMEQRFMWDADILVQQRHLGQAIDAAKSLGLAATGDTLPAWALNLLRMHALEVSHRGQAVDIHWRLRNRPGYRINYEQIWGRAQPMVIQGEDFSVLSDEDALTLTILEIAGDMERSHIKARSLWDLYRMLRVLDVQIDWDQYLATRQTEGVQRVAVNILQFLLLCLDCASECPNLSRSLQGYCEQMIIVKQEEAVNILHRPRQHLANRAIYARLQPKSFAVYWAWWFASAPLRFLLTRNF